LLQAFLVAGIEILIFIVLLLAAAILFRTLLLLLWHIPIDFLLFRAGVILVVRWWPPRGLFFGLLIALVLVILALDLPDGRHHCLRQLRGVQLGLNRVLWRLGRL
jgi:hypothetical protein